MWGNLGFIYSCVNKIFETLRSVRDKLVVIFILCLEKKPHKILENNTPTN